MPQDCPIEVPCLNVDLRLSLRTNAHHIPSTSREKLQAHVVLLSSVQTTFSLASCSPTKLKVDLEIFPQELTLLIAGPV